MDLFAIEQYYKLSPISINMVLFYYDIDETQLFAQK